MHTCTYDTHALPPVTEARLDEAALAFADVIDLKSRYVAAHSRRVGDLAEQLARQIGCAEPAVAQIRRAGLLHDLGLVAIPSYTLDWPWPDLSAAEQDAHRRYPYHGERMLKRVSALTPLAEMFGAHQERLDGSGYCRGLTGAAISLGARVIAVADRLDQLTHDRPERPARPVADAVRLLTQEPLDQEIVSALARCLGDLMVEATPCLRVTIWWDVLRWEEQQSSTALTQSAFSPARRMPMTNEAYSATVLDHFNNPRNAGELESPDGVGVRTNPVCGDTMRLMIRVAGERIAEARWQTVGCPAAIATSSIATEMIRDRPLDEVAALTREQIAAAAGGLPRSKLHCSVLAADALRAAIADYRARGA